MGSIIRPRLAYATGHRLFLSKHPARPTDYRIRIPKQLHYLDEVLVQVPAFGDIAVLMSGDSSARLDGMLGGASEPVVKAAELELTAVDLFSGAGGSTQGLTDARSCVVFTSAVPSWAGSESPGLDGRMCGG